MSTALGFSFLKLPGEVRNQIYRLILPNEIDLCALRNSRHFALLQTSHLVREETRAILYGESVFCAKVKDYWDSPPQETARLEHWGRVTEDKDASKITQLVIEANVRMLCHHRYHNPLERRLCGQKTRSIICYDRSSSMYTVKRNDLTGNRGFHKKEQIRQKMISRIGRIEPGCHTASDILHIVRIVYPERTLETDRDK